jgi:hypothetical protein
MNECIERKVKNKIFKKRLVDATKPLEKEGVYETGVVYRVAAINPEFFSYNF